MSRARLNPRLDDVTVGRIKLHYRRVGLLQPDGRSTWTRDRFNRLCKILHCTQRELAALCGLFNPGDLARWLASNYFPPHVALHFAMIESAYMAANGVSPSPLMPVSLLENSQAPIADSQVGPAMKRECEDILDELAVPEVVL